jgi:hypothetical protein
MVGTITLEECTASTIPVSRISRFDGVTPAGGVLGVGGAASTVAPCRPQAARSTAKMVTILLTV